MIKIKPGLPLLLFLIFFLNACTSVTLPVIGGSASTVTPIPIITDRPPLVPATLHPDPTASPPAAFDPTTTASPTAALDPTSTSFPSPTLTPSSSSLLVKQGPGTVVCPILLYHRIETPKTRDPYFVTPEDFRDQMHALKDWGYTTISATQLVQAINFGAKLPARPIVITFDDGDETVYTRAFPIMREFGFTGVNYIIVNYINTAGYMTVDQLKELAAAGWEIGSHSMTHADLTKSDKIEWEMVESRFRLGKLLEVPVNTFAYPYGKASPVMYNVLTKNYQAGMGLGVSVTQRGRDLWYLWRRPVELGTSLETFASYLPWHNPSPQ